MVGHCPLCRVNAVVQRGAHSVEEWECPVCGEFAMTEEATQGLKLLESQDSYIRAKLSAVVLERYLQWHAAGNKGRPPEVIVSEPLTSPIYPTIALPEVVGRFPRTVAERLDRALMNLARLAPAPGRKFQLASERLAPIMFGEDRHAGGFLFRALQDEALLVVDDAGISDHLSVTGWTRVAALQRSIPGSKPEQVFVAMWFDGSLADAYHDGFRPGINDAGYEALRIDQKQHINRIDDEIIAEIRQSRAVVADFTGQRGGVYYEAGFAHGLGIPVIMTVRKEDMEHVHFDTNHYNHIVWTGSADLRTSLKNRLLAVLGRGLLAPPYDATTPSP